ncbi:putative POM121-like protein 1, partial [Hylobates moloch]|uniref:putative POM121-like protein 1 n=1 Tax=Hylobates moloch TaxID=81572 RepID=UPI0026756482
IRPIPTAPRSGYLGTLCPLFLSGPRPRTCQWGSIAWSPFSPSPSSLCLWDLPVTPAPGLSGRPSYKHRDTSHQWCQDNPSVILQALSSFRDQQASAVCSEFQGILQLSHCTEHKDSLWGPGAGSHPFGAHNTRLSPDSSPGKVVLRALREGRAGMPEQDKDPRVQRFDDHGRVPGVTGDARSAFRPVRDNGGLSPFVPRPGPLQRVLHAQRPEVSDKERSQTSCTSSCTKRNAISSSYSSTGGFPWLKRRRGPASSHCQPTLSSSKKGSEDRPQAVSSGHTQCAPGQTLARRNGSPRSQASRPRGCKFPLLPRRRGEPLKVPPPVELGFRVTAEDLDREKAAFQQINSALPVEAKAISDCRPSRPSYTSCSLATGASGLPSVSKAPTMDAQQERHKPQDGLGLVAPLASAAGAPSTAPAAGAPSTAPAAGAPSTAPVFGMQHIPPGSLLFISSFPLPPTFFYFWDSAQVLWLIATPFGSSFPLPPTFFYFWASAQVLCLIAAPFPAASMDGSISGASSSPPPTPMEIDSSEADGAPHSLRRNPLKRKANW